MSHFTVLVIGEDPERQLQPFHEFECTGEDDEFVQNIDRLQEYRDEFAQYGDQGQSFEDYLEGESVEIIRGDAPPNLAGEHKYGYARVVGGEVVEVIRRTNPNKKWDWYVLGGRWSGMLKLKTGASSGATGRAGAFGKAAAEGYVDQCRISDIDIDGMRSEARIQAEVTFGRLAAFLEKYPGFRSWQEVRGGRTGDEVDDARREYRTQDGFEELSQEFRMLGCPIDEFGRDREAFVTSAVASCLSTFAVLKDGVWHERGQMGWWGCVSDEKHDHVWEAEFAKLIDGLPPDTLVSVFDCHI